MTHGIHEEKKFASPLPHAPPQTLPGPDKALRKTNKLPQEPHPQGKVPPGRKKEPEIADVDSPKTADTATLPSRLIPPPPTCPSGQWGGGLKPPPRRLDPNIYFLIDINAHNHTPAAPTIVEIVPAFSPSPTPVYLLPSVASFPPPIKPPIPLRILTLLSTLLRRIISSPLAPMRLPQLPRSF